MSKKKRYFKDTVEIKVTHNWYKRGLDPKLIKKLEPEIDFQVEDIQNHFKRDGWDLRTDYIVSDCLRSIFGNHISSYIEFELLLRLGENYMITYTDDGQQVIRKIKKGRKKK